MYKILFFVAICIVMISCNKDNTGKSGVIIKGKIPVGSSTKSQISEPDNASSLNDAKKILVFNGLDDEGTLLSISFADIVDGSFSAGATIGNAAALVFLNANNQYIGTLSTQGLSLLPLGKLADGENTTIDLSSLSLSGNNVLPSYDPFGNEIIISESEIKILKEIDGFFESLAKNIDADNDSIPDILNDKQLYIRTQFQLIAGSYGIDSDSAVISDSALSYINHTFFVFGGKGFSLPKSISLSGPQDNPYSDIVMQFFSTEIHGCGFGSGFWRPAHDPGAPSENILLPFKSGIYTITLDGKTYTIAYSHIDLQYNLLFVLPTLHTNSDGKLISISLEYRLPDNKIIDNPENILNRVMIGLTGENLDYTSPELTNLPAGELASDRISGLFSVKLDSPLDISKLHHVSLSYTDVLGNMYMLLYNTK